MGKVLARADYRTKFMELLTPVHKGPALPMQIPPFRGGKSVPELDFTKQIPGIHALTNVRHRAE